jgi:hypothetical protein
MFRRTAAPSFGDRPRQDPRHQQGKRDFENTKADEAEPNGGPRCKTEEGSESRPTANGNTIPSGRRNRPDCDQKKWRKQHPTHDRATHHGHHKCRW